MNDSCAIPEPLAKYTCHIDQHEDGCVVLSNLISNISKRNCVGVGLSDLHLRNAAVLGAIKLPHICILQMCAICGGGRRCVLPFFVRHQNNIVLGLEGTPRVI